MKIINILFAALTITILLSSSSVAQWSLDTVIATGNNTSGIAVTSGGGNIVITNNTSPGKVKIISASDYSVTSVDISSIEDYPNSVVTVPNDSVAVVNTLRKTIFININNNSIIGSFTSPCQSTTLYGIALTPDGQSVVYPDLSSGCTQQGIRMLDASGKISNSVFMQVNTSGELYGIAVSPDGSSAVLTTFSSDSPKIINLKTSTVQNISGISSGSYGIAAFHKSNYALIFDGDSLDLVSLVTNSLVKKISSLSYNTSLQNLAISADDKYAFCVGAFETLIISLSTDSVIQTLPSGGTNVASNADGSEFFITDSYNGTVTVFKKQNVNAVVRIKNTIPAEYKLEQNYPNPFNPVTKIRYSIPYVGMHREASVRIIVYDILGREIAILVNKKQGSGNYEITFDGSRLESGVYFYSLNSGNFHQTKKMILLK